MLVLEIKSIDIAEFKKEISDIPQDQWDSLAFIYGPTEFKGIYYVYRDAKHLSKAKLISYQEINNLKEKYESKT